MTTRFAILLTAVFVCGGVQAQTSSAGSTDQVRRLDGLNAEQHKAVDDYIRQREGPTGELRVIADPRRIAESSSEALRTLLPKYKFVAVTWIYEADSAALSKYSIPGPTLHTLVLDDKREDRMSNHTGYREEFGDLLRVERVEVTDARSAALVRSALTEIYGTGMSSDDVQITDLRHENSKWRLGYQQWPFRAISSYEQVREASCYLISLDAHGFVLSGRSVTEVLERRKLKADASSH